MSTTTKTVHMPLMDLPAVAERLGVNQRHIRRLVTERRIPFLKWGHLLRFGPAENRSVAGRSSGADRK